MPSFWDQERALDLSSKVWWSWWFLVLGNEPTEGSSGDQTGTILATASEPRPQAETLTSTSWPRNWRACLTVWRKQPRNECFPPLGSLWTCKICQLQRLSGCIRAPRESSVWEKKNGGPSARVTFKVIERSMKIQAALNIQGRCIHPFL